MNSKRPVLEYSVVRETHSDKPSWGFRFTTPEGNLLMESPKMFTSRAEAERGFVSIMKSVATNQYIVGSPRSSRTRAGGARGVSRRRSVKRHKALAGVPSLKGSRRRKASAFLF